MTTPFRIFSGWDRRQAEAAKVFAYSVLTNASIPVEVSFVTSGTDHAEAFALTSEGVIFCRGKRRGVTAFSYARFMVPMFSSYRGVALFADGCDQLCLGDVAELAAMPMNGHILRVVKHRVPNQRRPRVWTSLMLMDCSRLQWWTPEYIEEATDAQVMRLCDLNDEEIGDLPDTWNWLTEYGDREGAKILHWSHLSDPNGGSWIDRSGSALWAEWRQRWRAQR